MEKFKYTPPQNGYPEWNNNPDIYQLNRMKAHSYQMPFDTVKEALTLEHEKSRRYKCLNGMWKFEFAKNPSVTNKDFYKADYDTSAWDEIKVPAHWQLQGYDYPQYTNTTYPWVEDDKIDPPFAPTNYNPVGSYKTKFTVPEDWKGEPCYISFQGVESAFYVWVNGDLLGYSEDTFNAAEFDITPYLIEGENDLAVQVYRWCDASWLEDQDFWRLSGIFRDVYIYSTPQVHIYDFKTVATLDDEYINGILTVEATVTGYDGASTNEYEVCASLYDTDENVVCEFVLSDSKGMAEIPNVKKWSAEYPNLYKIVLELKDKTGKVIEALSANVGFRRFEMIGGLMHINGKKIVFKGTNRHEFSCENGRAVEYADMVSHIKLMKANNINAVRTSHYPNNSKWYSLCDEYGLYVIDENNLETHGCFKRKHDENYNIPGSHKCWRGAVLDRCESMLERDKNHPSILIWSLGNEAWGGENFLIMHDYFRSADPTRFVHYESTVHTPKYTDCTDMTSHMYTSPEGIEEYAKAVNHDKKPFILCEYSHAMGNSCGNIFKYTDLFDKYPILQGGFVWDWIDQAIKTKTEDGIEYLAYGGDFGEKVHSGAFSGNGLLFADGTPTPKLYEVKAVYQNVDFREGNIRGKSVYIKNKNLFTNLSEFDFIWTVTKNGVPVESGTMDIDIAPDEEKMIIIPFTTPKINNGEYVLTLSFNTKVDYQWAAKGHEVAFGQFIIPMKPVEKKTVESMLNITIEEDTVLILGREFSVKFDKKTGTLASYIYKNVELMTNTITPNFWRAWTNNDLGNKMEERCDAWRANSERRELIDFSVDYSQYHNHIISVKAKYKLPDVGKGRYRDERHTRLFIKYSISPDGEITVSETLNPGDHLPELPAFGMCMTLDKQYHNMKWYGRGPHESMWDRKVGAKIGLYQATIEEQYVPYLTPQECGNKTDVRFAEITNDNGVGILISGNPCFEITPSQWTYAEIVECDHAYKLPECTKTVLYINDHQTGVGGDTSWGTFTHPEFTLYANKEYTYSYKFKGIVG